MVHAGSHGRQEYKRPVAYDDPKRESITCYFQVYQNVQENVHDGIYKIGDSELPQRYLDNSPPRQLAPDN